MHISASQIKACIEQKLDKGFRNFIIFPFGDIGMQVQNILVAAYDLQPAYLLDNRLCHYNSKIHPITFLEKINCKEYCVILACSPDSDIYANLKQSIKRYLPDDNIAELLSRQEENPGYVTKVGKYSYGPICRNHPYIESIGAFCSFAIGTEVEGNHEMNYITTHQIIDAGPVYVDEGSQDRSGNYSDGRGEPWYFEGVQPKIEMATRIKRCVIGNDVWFGRNVIVTNYANIGNGVIAGAGSVITKDIPDYAVVVGAPARIIKYRFPIKARECLNKIAWWDWTDEEIRMRYDDFYLPVDEFIRKYFRGGEA